MNMYAVSLDDLALLDRCVSYRIDTYAIWKRMKRKEEMKTE